MRKIGFVVFLLAPIFVWAQQSSPPALPNNLYSTPSFIGSSVGGSNGQMQYNNNGAFGGASGITTNGSNTLTVGATGTATLNVGSSGAFAGSINIIGVGTGANLAANSSNNAAQWKIGAHNAHPLQEMEVGTCTMSAAATCTFAIGAAFNSTPLAFASDQAHVTTDTCSVSSTTVTITASASNSTAHNCALVGNPD